MKAATTTFLALLLIACSTGPEPINYGQDACNYCKMSIVEKPFGCEIVTSKGKVTKFDAIECLVAHYQEADLDNTSSVYVTDYSSPGTLMDGHNAVFLQCNDIPSPMGGFLSAHQSSDAAAATQKEAEGKTYSWEELIISEF